MSSENFFKFIIKKAKDFKYRVKFQRKYFYSAEENLNTDVVKKCIIFVSENVIH